MKILVGNETVDSWQFEFEESWPLLLGTVGFILVVNLSHWGNLLSVFGTLLHWSIITGTSLLLLTQYISIGTLLYHYWNIYISIGTLYWNDWNIIWIICIWNILNCAANKHSQHYSLSSTISYPNSPQELLAGWPWSFIDQFRCVYEASGRILLIFVRKKNHLLNLSCYHLLTLAWPLFLNDNDSDK